MKKNILLLLPFLCIPLLTLSQHAQEKKGIGSNRFVKSDFNSVKGAMNTMFKECIGAGRANEGLRADWQQQLAITHKECGFKYIRMHGLLTDDMAIYKEDTQGNPLYNFQYVDVLYDYIVSIGMKPFVELGFMPAALASGSQTIFWWKGNVTPPKDYQKWANLISALVNHFIERYGLAEVKTWYFEVWNEPNLSGFWAGNQDEYFKLYDYTAKAIKGIDKELKVGGPATAGAAWVPETISFCSKNSTPIDFISTHAYGVKQGFLDEYGTTGTILSKDEWSVSGDVINSRKQIAKSDKPNLELHYTEWSSSYTPADPIHDSYHEAAYILEKIKQVGDAANSMSYWVFTDIFEEAGPRFTPFHGGFGLINYQGIKKPAFYSYVFMNKLGSIELNNSDNASWVCKNAKGDVQILLWDFTNTHPGDTVNNQSYYTRDLPSADKGAVTTTITNVPKGKYKLNTYKVGYRVNDAYTTYIDLGKPNQLSKEQVNIIKKKNSGMPINSEIITIDGRGEFTKSTTLRQNDVIMYELIKI